MPRPLLLLAVLVACACGNDVVEEMPDPDLPPVTVNPDGVPYPTDHLGGQPRTATAPGDRLPPLTFRGYPGADRSKGLQTVAIADYYDPDAKRHKVLHIQFAGVWCAICASELDATVSVEAKLEAKGIVSLELLVSGRTAGKGPSQSELDGWVTGHHANFTTAVDVRARRVGPFGVSGTALPHDMLIDTRTMEILDSSLGAPQDVGIYDTDGLDFVTNHPPTTWD